MSINDAILTYHSNKTIREIAELTNVSIGTIVSHARKMGVTFDATKFKREQKKQFIKEHSTWLVKDLCKELHLPYPKVINLILELGLTPNYVKGEYVHKEPTSKKFFDWGSNGFRDVITGFYHPNSRRDRV